MPLGPPQKQAGDFRKPVTIEIGTPTPSPSGGSHLVFSAVFSNVMAADTHKAARAFDAAGALVTTVYHTYTIRYRTGVVKGMYLHDVHYPARLYIQAAIDPDGRRRYLDLACVDVE